VANNKYTISMDLQVLNHLGLNLYSNMTAVISETIANAWDADAKRVEIDVFDDHVIIKDDGIGMNLDDINSKYLRVGYGKRSTKPITDMGRKVMGRKGIGKLSLFSIAHSITVLSYKDGEKNAMCINTHHLKECIEENTDYYPQELNTDVVDFDTNGTKIILTDLKKRTSRLKMSLRQRVARRFGIIGAANNFCVLINGSEVTLDDRQYYNKVEYLWEYGGDEIFKLCNNKKHSEIRNSEIIADSKSYYISGWIATAEEPSKLRDEDENLNRIVLMIRGKMAKEDMLSDFVETGLYAKYVFGEINADFLDEDSEDDITTSNRQNLFEDDERYIAVKNFIKEELKNIKNNWDELRNKSGTEEALKFDVVKSWYGDLGKDDQKTAKNLFGKINRMTVAPEEKKELIKHGVLAFESLKLKNSLQDLDSIGTDNLQGFLKAAAILDDIEAMYYYQIVVERLAVIKKLKECVKDNELESAVQHHLAKNLWLLDPSWDRGTEVPSVEETIKTQLNIINAGLTQEEQDARFDIRYKKASNQHVVIELKRGHRTVRFTELLGQIAKYHSAMDKILTELKDGTSFTFIVLIGKPIDGVMISESTKKAHIESMKNFNARIMQYAELIANAEKMYSDFIQSNAEASRISNLIKQID